MDESVRAAGGKLGEFAIQGGRERPMAEVFRDIVGNVQEMVRSEVRLARAEVKEEASRAAAAGKLLAIGGVLGLFAAGFLLVCVAQLLMLFMPAWAATLAVGLVLGVVDQPGTSTDSDSISR